MSQTVSLTVLLAVSGLFFSLFGKYALDMRRDRKYRESWGWAAWALVPGFLSAIYLMSDAGVSMLTRNAVLGSLGAALGACIAIWLGYVLAAGATAQTPPPKPPEGEKVSDKPAPGKNSPSIQAGGDVHIGRIGDTYIFNLPPKAEPLRLTEALKADLLARIPKERPITIRGVGFGPQTQEIVAQIEKFLKENGYTFAEVYTVGALMPAPRGQLVWDGHSILTVAPVE
jgi:hypothetical protein